MDDEPVYDPSMPMGIGSPVLPHATLDTTPSAISTPPVLAEQVLPPPTDAVPSAATYSVPDFVLPGLREDVAEVEVETVGEEVDAKTGIRLVEEQVVQSAEEPVVQSSEEPVIQLLEKAVTESEPVDEVKMEITENVGDVNASDQVQPSNGEENAPLKEEETEVAQSIPHSDTTAIGEDDDDTQVQVDLEMDLVGDSDTDVPTPTEPAAVSTEAIPPTKEEPTTTPPPSRRPLNLQRRSPIYDTSTPSITPAYSLPQKPTDVVAASAYDINHRRSSSNTPSAGVQRSIAPLPSMSTSTPSKGRAAREKGWKDIIWPDGLNKDSQSVKRFPALVENWVDGDGTPQSTLALFEASCADGDVGDARAWFGAFQKENPTATRPLLELIDLELAHNNFGEVVKLFEKALRGLGGSVGAVPGVEIWSESEIWDPQVASVEFPIQDTDGIPNAHTLRIIPSLYTSTKSYPYRQLIQFHRRIPTSIS
jgi:hypothetical protein